MSEDIQQKVPALRRGFRCQWETVSPTVGCAARTMAVSCLPVRMAHPTEVRP